jgi:hypothetical protein
VLVVNIITVFCGQHDQRLEFFFGSKLKVSSFEREEKEKKNLLLFLLLEKCGRFKGQRLTTLKRQPKRVWPTKVSPYNGSQTYSAIITGKMTIHNRKWLLLLHSIFFCSVYYQIARSFATFDLFFPSFFKTLFALLRRTIFTFINGKKKKKQNERHRQQQQQKKRKQITEKSGGFFFTDSPNSYYNAEVYCFSFFFILIF